MQRLSVSLGCQSKRHKRGEDQSAHGIPHVGGCRSRVIVVSMVVRSSTPHALSLPASKPRKYRESFQADVVQAAQFGDWIGVVVCSYIEIGIRIVMRDLQPGGLFAALVAAGFFRRLAWQSTGVRALTRKRKRYASSVARTVALAGEHIAGDRNVLSRHMARPVPRNLGRCVGQCGQRRRGCETGVARRPDQGKPTRTGWFSGSSCMRSRGHRVDSIHRVDQRLGCQHARRVPRRMGRWRRQQKKREATATPSVPVAGSRARMDQVMGGSVAELVSVASGETGQAAP